MVVIWISCFVEGEIFIFFRVILKLFFRFVFLICCCSNGIKYRNVSSILRIRRVECLFSIGISKFIKVVIRFFNI